MRPLFQRKIKFENSCGCIVDFELLEKALLWYANGRTMKSLKKIFMYGKYPAVSCYNNKIHVHRLLMNYKYKRILPRTLYVHHLDENKLNALENNLSVIEMSKHQSLHNSKKILTKSHKNKISEANKRRRGISSKKRNDIPIEQVIQMYSEGMNITDISKEFKCGWSTIKKIIHEKGGQYE